MLVNLFSGVGSEINLVEKNCGRRRESRATILAASSIFSFPSMPLWPGIHMKVVCVGKDGEENLDALNERGWLDESLEG